MSKNLKYIVKEDALEFSKNYTHCNCKTMYIYKLFSFPNSHMFLIIPIGMAYS